MTEKAFLRLFIGFSIVFGHSDHRREVRGSNSATSTGQLQIVFRMFNGNSTVVEHSAHHQEVKGLKTTTSTRRVDIK